MSINKKWLIAAVKIAVKGMAALLVSIWLWVSSTSGSAPTNPHLETGNVVPFNNHGKTVYTTRSEDRIIVWWPTVFAFLLLVGVL